jgi:hypothetical protein
MGKAAKFVVIPKFLASLMSALSITGNWRPDRRAACRRPGEIPLAVATNRENLGTSVLHGPDFLK